MSASEKVQMKADDAKQMKKFTREYQMKNWNYQQLWKIYQDNALTDNFQKTKYSAIILILAPAITNLYYTFRPNSPLAKLMPFTMPVIAFCQYAYTLRQDMQKFCLLDHKDAKKAREYFMTLKSIEPNNPGINKVANQIVQLEKSRDRETQKTN